MALSSFRRLVGRVAVGALAVAVPVALAPVAASAAAPTELFLSEYVEGSAQNKALEIYNGTDTGVNLATEGYSIQFFANANTTPGLTINLTGSVAAGDVYVLAQATADPAVLAVADQQNTSTSWYNGNDTVVLRKGTTVVDSLGQIASNPATEWGTGLVSTADNTLRRKATVCAGDTNPTDAFDPSVEWEGFATNTFAGLGEHTSACGVPTDDAPMVTSVVPNAGATGSVNVRPAVTFSEAVTVAGGAFTLVCSATGTVPTTVTASNEGRTYTLDPTPTLQIGESCTVTVAANLVTDVDTIDPPDSLAADATSTFSVVDFCTIDTTPIPEIQGSGTTPALTGTHTTRGVVVGDYEGGASGSLRGFYLQDPAGDGDPATSDAIFVFNGSNENSVHLGDVVTVQGSVSDFQDQTQISVAPGNIVVCEADATVPVTDVALPMASATAFERYEGMLVTMPQTLSVTEHFQLGRFGEVLVSSNGRLRQPTNILRPGSEAAALQEANNLNQILIDDATNAQNPDPILFGGGDDPLSATNTLRGGDTITGVTGVMSYTFGGSATASPNAFRVRPVNALGGEWFFEAANPRPSGPGEVGGDVRVAAMNLLNYFNTFDGLPDPTGPNAVDNCNNGVDGPKTDCRGADTQAEFDRQWPKTVAAISKVNPDVLGVNEVENDGYGSDSALAHLVGKLNEKLGAGTYAYIDADAETGEKNTLGTDAIKVGMLYKPAKVTPVGDTAVLNTPLFVNGGDPAPRSRPSLAQAFEVNATGGVFVADVNHLKSKGSACTDPDAGDGQGNCNKSRTVSAKALATWLDTDPTRTGEDDVLILGDLNSYAKEDPIVALEDAGYTNLVERHLGEDAYSYVFDGQWGYLDHALGSPSVMSQVTGVAEYHINSDEPTVLDYNTDFKTANLQASLYAPNEFRVSDHDPVIVGLSPTAPLAAAFAATTVGCGDGNASLTVNHPSRFPGDAHTVAVAWGDGSATTTVANAASPLALGHTYAAAGVYTATVTVTDVHGHTYSTTAEITVEYTSSGILAPLGSSWTTQLNSTIPVKVAYTDCDGSVPTDLDPVVTVSRNGTTHVTGTATLVKGEWKYEFSTRGLAAGTYTVTVTVPETGQTDAATLTLRR